MAWLRTRVVLYVPVTLLFHCLLVRGTWVGISQCGCLIPLGMKMGTNLLGVCVKEGVTGGWLFVG